MAKEDQKNQASANPTATTPPKASTITEPPEEPEGPGANPPNNRKANPDGAEFGPYRALGEVVIEIGDDRNRNIMWEPTKQSLRGAWKRQHLVGVTMAVVMTQMPDIPGMYVVLDGRKRSQGVLDPLNAPQNKDLLEAIKRTVKEAFREDRGPEKDVVEENLTPSAMKTILYWMRRKVDAKMATLIHGTLPTEEEILALPGFVRAESWNSSARARKYREEPEEVVNERNAYK